MSKRAKKTTQKAKNPGLVFDNTVEALKVIGKHLYIGDKPYPAGRTVIKRSAAMLEKLMQLYAASLSINAKQAAVILEQDDKLKAKKK